MGIASSRKKLVDLKKDFDPNNIVVFGEGGSLEEINNNLAATPLFSTDRLVVLENPPDDVTNYQLPASPAKRGEPTTNYQLILWFDHEITDKKPIFSFVKENMGEILYFPESKEVSIFSFLDSLAGGDKQSYAAHKKALLEASKLKKAGFDLFYLVTMIFFSLRNLILTPKNAPYFVKEKLQRQRKRFNSEDIKNIYKYILDIEFKIKSGLLDIEHAEFLIINVFFK